MTKRDFKYLVKAANNIIERLYKELVELKEHPFLNKDMILSKEKEIELSIQSLSNIYKDYYGINNNIEIR